jgi:CubicO group peptidase (beta-lactamase class C family)
MIRRSIFRILAVFIIGGVVSAGAWFVNRTVGRIRVGTALISHTMCSGAFVSGLDPVLLYQEAVLPIPGQRALAKRLKYQIDTKNREVVVTWAGIIRSRAVYREGFGCMVMHGEESPDAGLGKISTSVREGGQAATGEFLALETEPANPKLEAALDRAFSEPNQQSERRVKAIVILHAGKIVAERYAQGYGANTPMLGFSLAKSVSNALIGILLRQKKLSVAQDAPVAEWANPSDPRHAITVDQLLRMTSGLALEESDSGADPVSRMLFREADMAGFAAQAGLKAKPGSKWEYTSGNTLILSRIIRDAVGGNAEGVREFAQRELFEPLGITTATIEFDATGTPVGSIFVYMSAGDWARFGQLFLNDGVVNGRRILPEGWVKYSASPTLDTYYGAGFWTNRGAHGDAKDRIDAGMPEDAFYGSGNLGQRVVVIPSTGLVVVRLGLTHVHGFDMRGLLKLVAETSAALK